MTTEIMTKEQGLREEAAKEISEAQANAFKDSIKIRLRRIDRLTKGIASRNKATAERNKEDQEIIEEVQKEINELKLEDFSDASPAMLNVATVTMPRYQHVDYAEMERQIFGTIAKARF